MSLFRLETSSIASRLSKRHRSFAGRKRDWRSYEGVIMRRVVVWKIKVLGRKGSVDLILTNYIHMEEVKEIAPKENETDPVELKILHGLVPGTKVLGVLGSIALGIYQGYFNQQ